MPLSRVQLLRQWGSLLTPGLLEADGICLSEKERGTLSHKLDMLVKRDLNETCGKGTSILLLPV